MYCMGNILFVFPLSIETTHHTGSRLSTRPLSLSLDSWSGWPVSVFGVAFEWRIWSSPWPESFVRFVVSLLRYSGYLGVN